MQKQINVERCDEGDVVINDFIDSYGTNFIANDIYANISIVSDIAVHYVRHRLHSRENKRHTVTIYYYDGGYNEKFGCKKVLWRKIRKGEKFKKR